jgi:Mu transposase-like protein
MEPRRGWAACLPPARWRRPLSVFEAVEAEALKPSPRSVFVLAAWSRPTVGPDIHVKVGKVVYSVPWPFIGAKVDARATPSTVQIFHKGELIATHPFKARGKQTDSSHYPPGEDRVPDAHPGLVPHPRR